MVSRTLIPLMPSQSPGYSTPMAPFPHMCSTLQLSDEANIKWTPLTTSGTAGEAGHSLTSHFPLMGEITGQEGFSWPGAVSTMREVT